MYIQDESSKIPLLSTYNTKKLSQNTFSFICTEMQNIIDDIDISIKAISKLPFSDRHNPKIRPIQCDAMVDVLSALQASIDHAAQSLKSANSLSVMILIDRYKLIMNLYGARDKSQRLIRELILFRSFCLKNTEETLTTQLEIQKEILLMVKQFEKIKVEVSKIMDIVLLETV